jgi:aldose 1-epimerase
MRTRKYATCDLGGAGAPTAPDGSPTTMPPDPPTTTLPTGQQWVIGHGRQELVVTEVGATIRSYTVGDATVVEGFGADEWSHDGRGQVLAPWPNRLGHGRYEFSGRRAQAPLNEPAHGNAIHGLVRWLPWRLEAQAQNVITAYCPLYPSPAYPFHLDLRVEYRLGRHGLTVISTAANPGDVALPLGVGFHPYLTVGTPRVDSAVLTLPADRRLVLDDRGLPTGEDRPVEGTECDFRGGRAVGPTKLDTAFTGLARDADGLAWVSLSDPGSDRTVSVWVDDRFGYLMVYSGDTLSDPGRRRTALAIEPMTCPPDALRSGRQLVVLEPGQEWQGSWGIRPS